jgi:hypothetical protein
VEGETTSGERNVKRYIIHPGYVVSANDGHLHYITAGQLVKLYQLPQNTPVVIISRQDPTWSYREEPGDVHLYPRRDGDYSLPS